MILGCCCNRCLQEIEVARFDNVTTVGGGSYSMTAPYTRPRYDIDSTFGCQASSDCGGVGEPVCYPDGYDGTGGAFYDGIVPGGTTTIAYNGYEDAEETVTISNPCYGWKAVAAKPVWAGRFGFINSGGACCPDEGGSETQVQSKYTSVTSETSATMTSRTTYNNCDGSTTVSEQTYTIEFTQTASVDEHGNLTRSGSVSVFQVRTVDGVEDTGYAIDSCDVGDATGVNFMSGFLGLAGSTAIIPFGDLPLDATCGVISVGAGSGSLAFPPTSGTAAELNAMEFYPLPAEQEQENNPCVTIAQHSIEVVDGSPAVFTISDSVLTVDWSAETVQVLEICCDPTNKNHVQENSMSFSKTVTLGGARTFDAVKADGVTLLAEWDLLDDAAYPWRYDASTWLVPMMTRDAAPTIPTIDWTVVGGGGADACDFISPSPYTGAIRGSPNPAGYDRHFNFDHTVWQAGVQGGSLCIVCEESYGELSASPLPATATQWTDKGTLQGPNMRGPGGWMTDLKVGQYLDGDTGGDGITMQKWAETIMAWPSLNYARPCARDRYLFNENAIACIDSFVWPDLEIEAVPLSGPTEFEVGDVIAIEDEVYQIATKTDAQNYTVGSKLYDLLIPCDGASKLRFPTTRGICGALAVVNAVQTSPGVVTITLGEAHWLKRDGTQNDTVDFTDVAGLGSGLTATVVDDESFTVPGTLGAWTSGGTVSQTGAQTAWDTTCSRKTFVTQEFQSRFREYDSGDPEDLPHAVTETERTYSSTSLARPYIVVISPNGETPEHGVLYDFGDIDADQCFGEQWHMLVVQGLVDPYWQADHVPCGHSGGWSQAAQPCGEDSTHYDYPPIVEAALTVPSGAPALPGGITLFPDGSMPGPVGHPNCDATPYSRGTLHFIRAAWEACANWIEKTMHKC